MFVLPGTGTNTLVVLITNSVYTAVFISCWPLAAEEDNQMVLLMLVATSLSLTVLLLYSAQFHILDGYDEGLVPTAFIGVVAMFFVLNIIILVKFQLPFVCKTFFPNASFNCYREVGLEDADDEAQEPPSGLVVEVCRFAECEEAKDEFQVICWFVSRLGQGCG